jgi:hypothetical protein
LSPIQAPTVTHFTCAAASSSSSFSLFTPARLTPGDATIV